MYQIQLNNRYGNTTLYENSNELEMANYLFENMYYRQSSSLQLDPIILIKKGENEETQNINIDNFIEKNIPKKTNEYNNKINQDKKFTRSKLIKYGIIKSHYFKMLEEKLKKTNDSVKIKP